MLTFLKLSRDDALVIKPNEPHAYLTGDLVECMANSDNVVRGGLTPKLKDKETLYNMLPYHSYQKEGSGAVKGTEVMPGVNEYKTGFEEFRVFKVQRKHGEAGVTLKFDTFSMAIVVQGCGTVRFTQFKKESDPEDFDKFKLETYCAYYIRPEEEFVITNEKEEELIVFIANCDI